MLVENRVKWNCERMSNSPRHFRIPFKWSCCKKSDWMMFFHVFSMCHSDVPQLLLKFAKFKVQPEKWVDIIIFDSDLHCLWQVLGSTQQGTQHRWERWRAAYPLHLSHRFEPRRRFQIYPSTAASRQQTLAAFTLMNLSSSSVKAGDAPESRRSFLCKK